MVANSLWALSRPPLSDAGRLRIQLKKLTMLGNVLYVGAHPDDENTAVLAALSLERGLRTAYLSLTRGDGGQNLLGSEQGEMLGIIRTQELLEARALDNAEQYFTRAIDFGFCKSAEEAIRFWGRDQIVADIVWVIRNFQPDVIITRFPSQGSSHGHHIASAILAEEAFAAASDPHRFPEQLKWVAPWQAKRLVWNRYDWGGQSIPEAEKAVSTKLQVGGFNPLLGLSYTEIAGLSRSMHKSQGMGASQFRGISTNYFKHLAGDPAGQDLMDGIGITWMRVPGGEKVGALLEEALQQFRPNKPSAVVPLLRQAYTQLLALKPDARLLKKKAELEALIQGCGGLWLEAISRESTLTPGNQVTLSLAAINRSGIPAHWKSVLSHWSQIAPAGGTGLETAVGKPLLWDTPVSQSVSLPIPARQPYTEPYWLVEHPGQFLFTVKDQSLIGLAELPFPLTLEYQISFDGQVVSFPVPILHRWVDSIEGERYRNPVISPEVSVSLKEPNLIFTNGAPKKMAVSLNSNMEKTTGTLALGLPPGWKSTPSSFPFVLTSKGQTADLGFLISPDASAKDGSFSAIATIDSRKIGVGTQYIDYRHITPQMALVRAEGLLRRITLTKNGQNLGYIMGSGDPIPEALRQIGYRVTLLSDEEIAGGDLNSYDTILAGIRAYNTRPVLKSAQPKLMDYVKNGGTLVVQYQTTDSRLGSVGPYPFRISRERVSVEDAPLRFLNERHPLLNAPNRISPRDFEGWVQERGLYFADQWDPRYETLLSCNDPGEPAQAGGILYVRYGQGVYIYTGYSWFRQLPAGVPGAYRLFVNLISAKGQP
jgi:LmbE family N-acetylglucosaminyl deacetylase